MLLGAQPLAIRMEKLKCPQYGLVHVMALHFVFGFVVGLTCGSILLAFDFAGLRSLIWRADAVTADLIVFLVGFAVTFGGMVSATAIMVLPFENELS
jgi:hypothetical protein